MSFEPAAAILISAMFLAIVALAYGLSGSRDAEKLLSSRIDAMLAEKEKSDSKLAEVLDDKIKPLEYRVKTLETADSPATGTGRKSFRQKVLAAEAGARSVNGS